MSEERFRTGHYHKPTIGISLTATPGRYPVINHCFIYVLSLNILFLLPNLSLTPFAVAPNRFRRCWKRPALAKVFEVFFYLVSRNDERATRNEIQKVSDNDSILFDATQVYEI